MHIKHTPHTRPRQLAMAASATTDSPCVLRFDGGSQNNPGPAGAGFVLYDPAGEMMHSRAVPLGHATNNVAEYSALIFGLRAARERGIAHLRVEGDSALVVNQVNATWKIKAPHLVSYCVCVRRLLGDFGSVTVAYIPRANNAVADKLSKQGVNMSGMGECVQLMLSSDGDASSPVEGATQ